MQQILSALKLDNIACTAHSWRYVPATKSKQLGAQIDLLFERDDNAITLCEIKYSQTPYKLTKPEAKNIVNKIQIFEQQTKTHKQLFIAIIAAPYMQKNIWSEDLIQKTVALKDLFSED